MRHSALLFLCAAGALFAVDRILGWPMAYAVAYGAVVLMAAMIAATFLWLWVKRATPLALGMAFSWAGTASVLGWWWVWRTAGQPEAMDQNAALFGFVALYLVGATLHFHVIERSMDLRPGTFAVPVVGAVLLSTLVALVI